MRGKLSFIIFVSIIAVMLSACSQSLPPETEWQPSETRPWNSFWGSFVYKEVSATSPVYYTYYELKFGDSSEVEPPELKDDPVISEMKNQGVSTFVYYPITISYTSKDLMTDKTYTIMTSAYLASAASNVPDKYYGISYLKTKDNAEQIFLLRDRGLIYEVKKNSDSIYGYEAKDATGLYGENIPEGFFSLDQAASIVAGYAEAIEPMLEGVFMLELRSDSSGADTSYQTLISGVEPAMFMSTAKFWEKN